MLTTTLGEIKRYEPCTDEWATLTRLYGTDPCTPVTLLQILDNNGAEFAYWALRCWPYRDYCILLADLIDSIAHLLPEGVNTAPVIRRWHAGEATDQELAAAARAAWDATGAGMDAAWAAWDAASATASAAWDAASAAAREQWKQWDTNEELMRSFLNDN